LTRVCVVCGGAATGRAVPGLCAGCLDDLPRIRSSCGRCGLPAPAEIAQCAACLRQPPVFDACVAPFPYRFPIDAMICRFKFHGDLASAAMLGSLFTRAQESRGSVECLFPVPLHWRRLVGRGYNQSAELARVIGREFGVPVEVLNQRRPKNTAPQMLLSGKERRQNLRRAFELARPVPYRHVAIVDDVVTTAHTANMLAAVLKSAGAVRVDVWAIARAEPPGSR